MTKTSFIKLRFQVMLVLITLLTADTWLSSSFQTFAALKPVGQAPSTWERITGKDEEFSVLMPGEPSLFINLITNPYRKHRLERIYSSYSKGSVYLVVSYDNFGNSIQDTVENFKAHHLYQGELNFERDVTLDGFKGKQYRLKLNEAVGILQCYVTTKHAYAVAIVQANDDPPLRQYFLSTFSLKRKNSSSTTNAAKGNDDLQGPPLHQTSDLPQGGQDANANAVFRPKDVARKAVVVSRPEPQYTEEARQGNISGTIVLRAVLSSSGEVTNLRVVNGLQRGLSAQAMEAARNLKFIPAIKDGRFVSQYIQIEYNFGLY